MSTRSRRVMGRGTIYRRCNGTWAGRSPWTARGPRLTHRLRLRSSPSSKSSKLRPPGIAVVISAHCCGVPDRMAGDQAFHAPPGDVDTLSRHSGGPDPSADSARAARQARSRRRATDAAGSSKGSIPANGEPCTGGAMRARLRRAPSGEWLRNVGAPLEPVKVPQRPPHPLARRGWDCSAAIEDPQLRRWQTLAVHSGLRLGELLRASVE